MAKDEYSSDDLVIPFIFVPHGHPLPTDWLAAHPGAIRLPATRVPRKTDDGETGWQLNFDMDEALAKMGDAVELDRAGGRNGTRCGCPAGRGRTCGRRHGPAHGGILCAQAECHPVRGCGGGSPATEWLC